VCPVPSVPQKSKRMKTNNAEAVGDDEESMVSSGVAEVRREKKKEKLVLKKPPEKKIKSENEYKQWYKSYVIKVTTAPTVACTSSTVSAVDCP
jgi:hypothetical protein